MQAYTVHCYSCRRTHLGEVVALYTDLLVREDVLQLFGFQTLVEKETRILQSGEYVDQFVVEDGKLLIVGVTILLFVQTAVNLGMTVGLTPITHAFDDHHSFVAEEIRFDEVARAMGAHGARVAGGCVVDGGNACTCAHRRRGLP